MESFSWQIMLLLFLFFIFIAAHTFIFQMKVETLSSLMFILIWDIGGNHESVHLLTFLFLATIIWYLVIILFIYLFLLNVWSFIQAEENCWCNHNNNENNTTRNWIILLNIISIKKGITQHNLDWGAALALFKEIQALGWLNFVTGADFLWLVSPRIQQPNKCCMARIISAQSVQAQNSTRKNTLPCLESLYFFLCVYCMLQ